MVPDLNWVAWQIYLNTNGGESSSIVTGLFLRGVVVLISLCFLNRPAVENKPENRNIVNLYIAFAICKAR